jgi:streptogramin lyase
MRTVRRLLLFSLVAGQMIAASLPAQAAQRITEYAVPTPRSWPYGITSGPDGNLWFTENVGTKIGRITTDGVITEYIPTPGTFPYGITSGPDGNLWFTERLGNTIGRVTTGGVITEYAIHTPVSHPSGITSGPDGKMWFTEYHGNRIGALHPSTASPRSPA